jgi:hypothetical protein
MKNKFKILSSIFILLVVILSGCKNQQNATNSQKSKKTLPVSQQVTRDQTNIGLVQNSNSSIPDIYKNLDTSKSLFEQGCYDYQGNINQNIGILMSIYKVGNQILGSYIYESQNKEISLKGKSGDKNIILYEYDKNGNNTGIFEGSMTSVDKITGQWTDGKKTFPFTLVIKDNITGAEYGKRYSSVVTKVSDKDVGDFANRIKDYISNNDKENVANLVDYPVTLKVNGVTNTITSKDDFIKNYEAIFTDNYKETIKGSFTEYMFVNDQGIMLGDSTYNMWINEEKDKNNNIQLMITAINN